MLRHILYDYQQPTVPLNDEIEFLENYVKLMRIRLPETVNVTFTSEIQDSNVQIAPMIFISLVENAFKHGISPTGPSFIRISISADKHFIHCDIQNSNHPKTESDHSGHGIGLQQVQRRLELAYPDHYTWQKGTKEDNTVYYSTITIQL
jgi:LytS/YehU family sensor histidine kinase